MRERVLSITIKDCEVQTFRVSGAGGQHRDKTSAGVRVVHKPSGAVGQATEDRSQGRNRRIAFRRMAESVELRMWIDRQLADLPPIEDIVDELMHPDNLIIEYYQPR